MNRIGARSNSGEGGEDPTFYRPHDDGDRHDNKIKQVASARFGVTTAYLAHAEELEIKMAQGSKPGEGGQLPAHKVTDLIARLRHAVPGIQPDLAATAPRHLLDRRPGAAHLRPEAVNPRARVGVKLVSEAGVGTVAAGVAKAYADYVLVSGIDGGTGAQPAHQSIKHAGSPWELGVAETQQVLVRTACAAGCELRTDGGLQDAAATSSSPRCSAPRSYGFGTASLVAIGCDMARQCHLNTCPTGIATQRADLRAKFTGTPEQVIDFFVHLAEEIRETPGRAGRAEPRRDRRARRPARAVERPDVPRAQMLDLSVLLAPPIRRGRPAGRAGRSAHDARNDRPRKDPLDERDPQRCQPLPGAAGVPFSGLLPDPQPAPAVGARVAGEIAERHGDAGLPRRLRVSSSASSAARGRASARSPTEGMRLTLEGEANDYVGKGLSGGEIDASVPFRAGRRTPRPHEHVIVGNTVLYGATAGKLFAAGRAGERFAVRNSGATPSSKAPAITAAST